MLGKMVYFLPFSAQQEPPELQSSFFFLQQAQEARPEMQTTVRRSFNIFIIVFNEDQLVEANWAHWALRCR